MFYGGAALLAVAVLLAIIFIIKKPKYTPESAAYAGADPGRTQSLRNGYPTDRMTIRRESVQTVAPEKIEQSQETELLTDLQPGTERLQETEVLDPQQTEAYAKE